MKKLTALIVTAVIALTSLSAIAGPYTLSITPSENGRVSVSPVKDYYDAGDIITFTAIPNKGYSFVQFTYNEGVYLDNPLVVSPTRDMELSVEFVYSGYTINVSSTEGGTVKVDPEKATYTKGEPVTITAIPDEGSTFEGFSGTITTEESTLLIYVDQDYDLTAHFSGIEYSLTVEQTIGGTLTIDPDKPAYLYNEEVSYEAAPLPGYSFDKIEGYIEELTEPSGQIAIQGDYYLVPRFTPVNYHVTVVPPECGTVALSPDKFFYNYGEEVTVLAIPESGLEVYSITVNGEPIEGTTFTVTGNTEVEVLFSLSPLEPAGYGTEANPFLIASPENLVWMEKQAAYSENFFYTLTADIDLHESEYWRGGLGFPPIGTETAPFSGTFDGNNFTIKNLFIETEEKVPQGLFGCTRDAIIKNVNVLGVVKGYERVGLLVGYADNTEFSYCGVMGQVEGTNQVGLLAGVVIGGSFSCCTVEGLADGFSAIGGMIGKALDPVIANCISAVTVKGDSYVGGIAGEADFSKFTNCLALGSARGSFEYGGIGGSAYESTATGCFFDSRKSRSNNLGTGITKEQIADKLTYTGWDFINIWQFYPGDSFPTIRPYSPYAWTPVQGESVTTFSLSCTVTKEDIETCNNTIFIYSESEDAMIVNPAIIPSLPVKDKDIKVQYNQKKGVFKYASNKTLLNIGSITGDFAWPFSSSNDKQKLTFTLTTEQDISKLFNKTTFSSLADPNMVNHALNFTTVELTQKGNNLTYSGAQDGVTMKVKINTKNQKCTLKATLENTISLITSPDPDQQKK